MQVLYDGWETAIRLTDERLAHILGHPEMARMEFAIAETIQEPESIVRSLSDEQARLYYRSYQDTPVVEKFVCVVVKVLKDDAFIVTAYLTDINQERRVYMGQRRKAVKLWYDPEGDYMEVIFEEKAGYFRETGNDRVMEKVDEEGNVLGFSVLKVSSIRGKPFEIALV